ncbi:MAG: RluA family pseudouridine synthase, partial [Candidatus Omnitrophica bacterium CG07_land_8_20_14_0_80_50_8]
MTNPVSDIQHKVSSLYSPTRIDVYLTRLLKGKFSRQTLKTTLEKGGILINGKPAKPRILVKEGDWIQGALPAPEPSELSAERTPLNIVYEDADLLVIDKPAGMVVHPGAGNKKGTLVHALLGHGSPLSSLGGQQRPGIVHRLDKETSGLLLVAKNNRAHRGLGSQFESRTLSKTYTALVRGSVEFEQG